MNAFGRAARRARTAALTTMERLRKELLRPLYRHTIMWLAARHRSRLHDVVFIGITGSCGKTTTKRLVTTVLSHHLEGAASEGTLNQPSHLARTLLGVKPSHRFYVHEIGVPRDEPIGLEVSVGLLRPQIAVVTNVGTDHISRFGSLEAIAAEKAKLVAAVPPHGTAILNADDPHVLAMRGVCRGRVLTYGLAPEAIVRACDVSAAWPDRLSFTVLYEGQSARVQTELLGAHWISSVLPAIAAGLAMGLPLASVAASVKAVRPVRLRMSPERLASGVDVVRDDCKTPSWSIPAAMQFVKDAKAARKFIVMGSISDYQGNSDRQYVKAARQALDVADHVVFVGPRASKSLKARRGAEDGALQAFYTMDAAADHLRPVLRAGDLLLLKGGEKDDLGELLTCLERPATPRSAIGHTDSRVHAVIGLGNPGQQYHDTPHNVGFKVVEAVADALGATWVREDRASVASAKGSDGSAIYLVKPMTGINFSGPVLARVAQHLAFGPAACVVIHDDVDLPCGTVRERAAGGDGGHRGVASILKTFGTAELHRIKVGVGRPRTDGGMVRHVVTALDAADTAAIDTACAEAAALVLKRLPAPRWGPGDGFEPPTSSV